MNSNSSSFGAGHAAVRGAIAFGAVSIGVYGTVAFAGRWLYRHLTEPGAYAFWAALYLVGAPWLMGRLLVPAGGRRRFGMLFVLGFVAYSLGWVAAYFPMRNKPGEILASVIGPALFACVLCVGFRQVREILRGALVLSVGHGLGYFAGDALNTAIGGPAGMVLWGVCHGIGYGAALGWLVGRLVAGRTVDVQPPGGA